MDLRVLTAALAAAALLASGCGDDQAGPPPPGTVSEPASAGHIHGLGINPADGALFIATHTGLLRAAPDESRAEPVGADRQDTMGFTVVGPDRFVGSGHPDVRSDAPPLLGLIRSSDAGRTWRPVSLRGEADFHVLRAAANRIYGFDATKGRLMVSPDGGESWQVRTPPGALFDLAPDPEDPDRVVASSERGIAVSRDAGRRWRPVDSGRAGLLAWTRDGLFLVDGGGMAHRSSDAGRSWEGLGNVGGQPAAFAAHEDDLYVALHTNEVRISSDGARTWRTRVAS